MKTVYKYIHFELYEEKPEPIIWVCRNTEGGFPMGEVKWHSEWNAYCYFNLVLTVYNARCLEDIKHFIEQLMEERKK